MGIPNTYTWAVTDTLTDSSFYWYLTDASEFGWAYMVSQEGDVWLYDLATETLTQLADISSALRDGEDVGPGAMLIYRPPAHEGNTYGALYLMQGNSTRNLLFGTIDSSDGETITWGAKLDTAFTQEDESSYAYDYENDILYYASAGETRLFKCDLGTSLWELTTIPTSPSSGWYRPALAVDPDGVVYILNEVDPDWEFYTYTPGVGWNDISSALATAPNSSTGKKVGMWFRDRFWYTDWSNVSINWIDYYDPDTGTWDTVTKSTVRGQVVATTHWANHIEHFVMKASFFSSSLYVGTPSMQLMERSANLTGKHSVEGRMALDTPWNIQRHGVLIGKHTIESPTALIGKPLIESPMAIDAQGHLYLNRKLALLCAESKTIDRNVAVNGRHYMDRSMVIKGKQFLNRSLCIASYPRVDPNFKLQKQYMEITSIEPFYEDRGSPLFFNELVVEYNGDQEGNFTSAVTLRSILSINYYGETVSKRVEMPYVYTQENALKVGREYLEQAHVVPLKMSINYERALPGIQTMDTVEIVEWPGGIAEDGYFRNLICFVQRIVTDNTRNRVALEVVTRDYHHLPPLIETTYLNDTQGFGGSIAVASFSQSRSFTVTSNSAGNPPIAGAQVTIIQTGETKTTDASGQVVFDLLPGRYRLLIRGAGYRESSFEVIVA